MVTAVKTSTRTRPRDRTRALLVSAAQELLRDGQPLTVTAVAEHAGVSRATAYRYFNGNDAVLLQATLPLHGDPLAAPDWPYTHPDPDTDLPTRAAVLVRSVGEWAFDHEQELRTVLALSLRPDNPHGTVVRTANLNRGRWVAALLADLPTRVTAAQRRRLAAALMPLFGAEAVTWTRDVAQLNRRQALDALAWMAYTLVHATLAEAEHAET